MADEMIYQTFINKSDDMAELRPPAPKAARRATREVERTHGPSCIGLPAPPPVGATALAPGTFAGVAVFVTGGGTGLGKAIATEFARLGASIVVIASRKPEHLDAGRDAIGRSARRSLAVACDIRDPSQIAAAFDAAEAAFGLPGVLVNNAAANFPVPAEDMSPNAWRTVVDITLNGTFFCAREFGRRHLAAGTPGSIINVGASYAWTGGPASRTRRRRRPGVKNLTETLAVEWGPYGIQVNGLVPGLVPARGHDRRHPGQPRPHRRQGRLPAGDAGRAAAGAGLGRDLPRVAVRAVHLRPHARRRRRELAAPHAHQPAGRDRARADGPRPLRAVRQFFERNRAALAERGIDPARLPPGQYFTERFPVLHVGDVPDDPTGRTGRWRVGRRVASARTFTLPELLALPERRRSSTDIHCVTKWSKFDTTWQGVRFRDLLGACVDVPPAVDPRGETPSTATPRTFRSPTLLADECSRVRVRRCSRSRRARRPGAAGGAAPLLLEVGEVVARHRARRSRPARVLGANGYHNYGDPWREQRYWGD